MSVLPSEAVSPALRVLKGKANSFNSFKLKDGEKRLCDGFLMYGEDDDYPELISRLIENSPVAKMAATKLADFLVGDGFEDENINEIIIGSDFLGRPVTMYRLLKETAEQISYYAGCYWKVRRDLDRVVDVSILDFKTCRIGLLDDMEKICAVMHRRTNSSNKPVEDDFYIFTYDPADVSYRFNTRKINIPEVYCGFYNTSFIYPVSFIEPASLNADTDYQIGYRQNTEVRNGMAKTTFVLYPKNAEVSDENGLPIQGDNDKTRNAILDTTGPGAAKVVAIGCELDNDGNLREDVKTVSVDSNIQTDILQGWSKDQMRAICMVFFNIPEIIVKSSDGSTLNPASGEMLKVQYEIYNQNTAKPRKFIEDMFNDVFKFHKNQALAEYKFKIKEKTLNLNNIQDANTNTGQATVN